MTQTPKRGHYSPSQRQRLGEEARAHRQRGKRWAQIAETLDVSARSLRTWMKPESQVVLRPVEVVESARMPTTGGWGIGETRPRDLTHRMPCAKYTYPTLSGISLRKDRQILPRKIR